MVKIISCGSPEWNSFIELLPSGKRDIYFREEYYKLQENNGDGSGRLFVYIDGDNIALYPFLINEIIVYKFDTKYYDIESAYGYGGPISNCSDITFLNNFEASFINYCINNNIVAEFIRFHPLLNNHLLFNNDISISQNRKTVSIDLTKNIDEIWKEQISSKNRNVIRKAMKTGLTIEYSTNFDSFINLYKLTMDKVNAAEYYYFKSKYFDNIKSLDYTLINVKYQEEVVSTAVFLGDKEYFHYHLAASREEYLKFSPNNLILWEAIKYSKLNNYSVFHLGGGINNTLDDSLFKFKKSFSKDINDFYIGRRIHNKYIYETLINKWEATNHKKSSLFLQYKYN